MRRLGLFLLTWTMMVAMCACNVNVEGNVETGGEEEPVQEIAKITKMDGTVEELTQEEIKQIYDSNEANYNNNYKGCEVELEAVIESIEVVNITYPILGDVEGVEFNTGGIASGFTFHCTYAYLEDVGIDVNTLGTGTRIKVFGELGGTFIETEIDNIHDLTVLEA